MKKNNTDDKEVVNQPDPHLHKIISFWKSGLRILAGSVFFSFAAGYGTVGANFVLIGIFIIAAELLGVAEELV